MVDIEAPIKEVTVYPDRALVTRQGKIELEAGVHELCINHLPLFFRDSLRAAGQGPQGTRILDVDIRTAFLSQAPDAEIQAVQHELEQLQQQRQILLARQEALKERRHWLHLLGEQSRDFARGLAQGQMKPQDCADFFSFMAEQSLQDAQSALDFDNQARQIQREIEAKERELANKQGGGQTDRLAVTVALELAEAGEVELEISYIVTNASWHPQYDVRVHFDEGKNQGRVELTYMGMVQQSSGERWENVELSLSTARPSLAAIVPELKPWYLKVYSPPPPPMPLSYAAMPPAARSMAPASKKAGLSALSAGGMPFGAAAEGADDNIMLDAVAAVPAPQPVEVATASVERTGTALVFHIGRSVDIPSDGSPHKTVISRDDLPCEFDYVCAPALEETIHLRATITNTTERTLLAGDASIFLLQYPQTGQREAGGQPGSEYVGTTPLKLTVHNEQFKLFLGIDDAIKVKRVATERSVDKGNLLQNDLRRITYAYQITVHNYAQVPRKIEVRDHLPVAQHERIKVRIQQIQPPPAERSKLELLTWNMTIPAGGELKLEYRFVVEHPQGLQVIGLPKES